MRTRHTGFTLFELMVSLAIMGILVSLAVPSFQEYGRNTRVVAAQNDLVTALNLARSEAIRRSTPVSVCATSNFTTCANSTFWVNGWLAFSDATGTAGVLDGTDAVLQMWRGPGAENVTFATTGTNPQWIQFTATGLVNPTTTTKTYLIQSNSCNTGDVLRRRIQVSGIGAIRNERVACL
jgi:type IV fimbrial biogenesis protein FimT